MSNSAEKNLKRATKTPSTVAWWVNTTCQKPRLRRSEKRKKRGWRRISNERHPFSPCHPHPSIKSTWHCPKITQCKHASCSPCLLSPLPLRQGKARKGSSNHEETQTYTHTHTHTHIKTQTRAYYPYPHPKPTFPLPLDSSRIESIPYLNPWERTG